MQPSLYSTYNSTHELTIVAWSHLGIDLNIFWNSVVKITSCTYTHLARAIAIAIATDYKIIVHIILC